MQYKWLKKDLDKDLVKELVNKYQLDPLLASILIRRGIAESDFVYYLENKEIFTHNPFLLTDLEKAAERILEAIYNGEQVTIFGDRDTDGITGESALALFFKKRKLDPMLLVPLGDDAYGLKTNIIEELSEKGVTLIICVDNGSSCHAEVEFAKNLGIDVIIVDHHDIKEPKIDAFAFVNPKQDDNYPNKALCASALVSKLLFALNYIESAIDEHVNVLLNIYVNDKNEIIADCCRLYRLNMGKLNSFNLTNVSDAERFIDFVRGALIFVWHATEQTAILESIFNADVALEDLSLNLKDILKDYTALSLNDLATVSALTKYKKANNLELIYHLYRLWIFSKKDLFSDYYEHLDLATIGLVGDMMDLSGENRILVKMGLKLLSRPIKDTTRYLLNHLGLLGEVITASSIGFKISPFINSSGRMGKPNLMLDFFTSIDSETSLRLLGELEELSKQRKDLSEKWWHKIQDNIFETKKRYNDKIIYVDQKDLPRGLTGLLAGKISRIYKNSLVLIITCKEDSKYVASMRCSKDGVIDKFISLNKASFIDYGGHGRAAGFTTTKDFFSNLGKVLDKFASSLDKIEEEKEKLYIDAELNVNHLNENLLAIVKKLEPYGESFKPIVFATKNVKIKQKMIIGKINDHIKLNLEIDEVSINALWWGSAFKYFDEIKEQECYDIVYHVNVAEKNTLGFYLEIIDLRLCSAKN